MRYLALLALFISASACAAPVTKTPHPCVGSVITENDDALCPTPLTQPTITAQNSDSLAATIVSSESATVTACVRVAGAEPLSQAQYIAATDCAASATKTGTGTITFTSTDLDGLVSGVTFDIHFAAPDGNKYSPPTSVPGTTTTVTPPGGSGGTDLAGLGYYFIDPTNGNDSNSGLSGSPWQTASKMNNAGLPSGARVYVKANDPLDDQRLIPNWANGRLDCYYADPGNSNQLTDCDEGTEAGQHVAMINGTADATCRAASNNTQGCAHGSASVAGVGAVPAFRYQGLIDVAASATGFHVDDFQVMDSPAEGVYIRADDVTIEDTEVGYPFWGGIRYNARVTGGHAKNNLVHHQPYCKYAANVLSHNYYDPVCGGGGGPPAILMIVGVTDGVSSATAEGNRVHTGWREGIGCFTSSAFCHVIGNTISGIRVVGVYIGGMSGAVVESNIVYGATDDDWYPDHSGGFTSGIENNAKIFQPTNQQGENEEVIYRNNACVNNGTSCFNSILTDRAVDRNFTNTLNVKYGTVVDTSSLAGTYREASNSNGQYQMVNSFLQNTLGYTPNSSKEVDDSGETTYDNNMWPSAVNESVASDGGDVIATPTLASALSSTYTIASPPTFADVEYSSDSADGVGDATPFTTTTINTSIIEHFNEITWWSGKGVTLANWLKTAYYDCNFDVRDSTNPDIGACER